jgi:hydroxymethylbilane synthase
VGTSSARRRSLLHALYPELEVVHLKGDLVTRLRKVEQGQVHATIVPAASLHLLEVSQLIAALLDPPLWLPTPGQGATAIQARAEDEATLALVEPMADARTTIDTAAERALLHSLEGGLQSPIGALVQDERGQRVLRAVIVDLSGRRLLRSAHAMDDHDPALVGIRLANELRSIGASEILDELRAADRLPAPQPE